MELDEIALPGKVSNEMLYVGITRAQLKLYIIGSQKCLRTIRAGLKRR